MNADRSLLGVGIYTITEAARMTDVSSGRIRRWLRGYKYRTKDEQRESPPVWRPDLPIVEDTLALSFRDLMEVRFVDYFIDKGVSWKMLRRAAQYASEIVGSTHPFATRKFQTDGHRIFSEFGKRPRERRIMDVVSTQYSLPQVEPLLYKGLEFASDINIVRWFPMAPSKRVVVDPAIAFGQPTVSPEGVPTSILAKAMSVEQSVDRVAKWYEISKRSVAVAVEFETRLAA
jgi:uncharacterized protein (DUF433 family)